MDDITRKNKAIKYMTELKSLPLDVLDRANGWIELNPLWCDKKHNPRNIVNGGVYSFIKILNRRFSLGFNANEVQEIIKEVYKRRS